MISIAQCKYALGFGAGGNLTVAPLPMVSLIAVVQSDGDR
jgi:hypothetical protein